MRRRGAGAAHSADWRHGDGASDRTASPVPSPARYAPGPRRRRPTGSGESDSAAGVRRPGTDSVPGLAGCDRRGPAERPPAIRRAAGLPSPGPWTHQYASAASRAAPLIRDSGSGRRAAGDSRDSRRAAARPGDSGSRVCPSPRAGPPGRKY
eukprot:358609-Hanusia_phi.AAC.1